MVMGRPPRPTVLKVVGGTLRRDRENKAEAKLELRLPEPPSFLSVEAREEWDRMAGQLFRSGLLTDVDRGALAAYCQAYGRWAQAERRLAEMAARDASGGGALMIATVGGNFIQNPIVGIANKSMADMVRYSAEFGMTPSARSRVHASPPEKEDAGVQKYDIR